MRLYLDDSADDDLLIRLLQRAGHTVESPRQHGLRGVEDDEHLAFAHGHGSAVITFDCADFLELHRRWQGQAKPHSGIVTIYRERDVSRNLTHAQAIVALRKLEVSGTPIANEFIVLNQWR